MKLTRFYGHFEGDAMTYRAPDEVANARDKFRSAEDFQPARGRGVAAEAGDFDAVDKDRGDDRAACLAKAKAAPMPTEADLLTDVYLNY